MGRLSKCSPELREEAVRLQPGSGESVHGSSNANRSRGSYIGLPELYRELPKIVGVRDLDRDGLTQSTTRLRDLVERWTSGRPADAVG